MNLPRVSIGVDPGLQGAIALLREGGKVEVVPMPVLSAGKGGRELYNLEEIHELLDLAQVGSHAFLTLEKLQPMPMEHGGSIANFHRGRALAIFEAFAVSLAIPYQLVAPRTWQKWAHAGTSGDDKKQRSIVAAKRLFPGVSLLRTPRCRKDSDGLAEALLLAEHGRRTRDALEPAA